MDWALIDSADTFGPNISPPSTFGVGNLFREPQVPPLYELKAHSKVRNMGLVELGDWVFKRGRTSASSGTINMMKRPVQWPAGKRTLEIEILSADGPFVSPRDSGAIVTDLQGEIVGLIFA